MLWVPQKGVVKAISNYGLVGTTTPGTGLPSNGTTLLDGAVTEIISAAANVQDSWGIEVVVIASGALTTASEACVDILIGGATDDVLIPALICGYAVPFSNGGGSGQRYLFPLHIPQGVRIAAQLASVRTSITAQILVTLFGGSPPPWRVGRKVTAIGTQVNNARGQALTAPGTSGGAATVTEMVASSAEDYFAFLPGFQPATDTSVVQAYVNIGIGVGAATEERIGTWFYKKDTNEDVAGPMPCFPCFRDVPAGTRLSLLASTSNSANDADQDGMIYAVS